MVEEEHRKDALKNPIETEWGSFAFLVIGTIFFFGGGVFFFSPFWKPCSKIRRDSHWRDAVWEDDTALPRAHRDERGW
ncbi:unnamed protein product [Calypogeia fissa]